jgi:hypothetical protein
MATHHDQYLSRRTQAERYDKNIRTIARWGLDPRLGYPREYDLNGRPARKLSELEAWERSRAAPDHAARRRARREQLNNIETAT